MVLDASRYPVTLDPEQCVCGQLIPDTAIYFGFPLSEDADQPIAWINEWHDHCLSEWGWVRDDSDWGIAHRWCAEQSDEDVRPS